MTFELPLYRYTKSRRETARDRYVIISTKRKILHVMFYLRLNKQGNFLVHNLRPNRYQMKTSLKNVRAKAK